MSIVVQGLFNRALFGGQDLQRRSAAEGLSQTFATILSRQMRQSMVGVDSGPMGIGGGATGDIYGSFMDDAMGKLLARSPAMKSLNAALEHDLGGTHNSAAPRGLDSKDRLIEKIDRAVLAAASPAELSVPFSGPSETSAVSEFKTAAITQADNRGPLILPPAPSAMVPDLPPPSKLGGTL
ncbi:MAG TPA: hypothetical protein VKS22_16735 [Candidatus Binataceae bacterium]|nr:hypothetical protein [Candidatus Binataceae bacterium]